MGSKWDAGHLLAAAVGRSVQVWQPWEDGSSDSLQPAFQHTTDGKQTSAVTWSANSKILIGAGDQGRMDLYSDYKHAARFPDENAPALPAGVSAIRSLRSKELLLGQTDGCVTLLPLSAERLGSGQRSPVHAGRVLSVAASPDHDKLASSDATGKVMLHQRDPFALVCELPRPPQMRGGVLSLGFASSRASAQLLAACNAGAGVLVWDIAQPSSPCSMLLATAGANVTGVAFSPSSPNVLHACIASPRGRLATFDLRSGTEVAAALTASPSLQLTCLAPSEDGGLLAVGTQVGTVLLYDAQTLSLQRMLQSLTVATTTDLAWQPRPQRRSKTSASSRATSVGASAATYSSDSTAVFASPPRAQAAPAASAWTTASPTTYAKVPPPAAQRAQWAPPAAVPALPPGALAAAPKPNVPPPVAHAAPPAQPPPAAPPVAMGGPPKAALHEWTPQPAAAAAARASPPDAASVGSAASVPSAPASLPRPSAAAVPPAPGPTMAAAAPPTGPQEQPAPPTAAAPAAAAVGIHAPVASGAPLLAPGTSGEAGGGGDGGGVSEAQLRALQVALEGRMAGVVDEVMVELRGRLLDLHMEVVRQAHDSSAALQQAMAALGGQQRRLEEQQAALREAIAHLVRRAEVVRLL